MDGAPPHPALSPKFGGEGRVRGFMGGQTNMRRLMSLGPEALTFLIDITTAGTVKPMANANELIFANRLSENVHLRRYLHSLVPTTCQAEAPAKADHHCGVRKKSTDLRIHTHGALHHVLAGGTV
jgi:hypothetical protein